MKKIFVIVLGAMLFWACSSIPMEERRYNVKLADYLYAVEYEDYNFDECKAYFDSKYIPAGGCSEVRRGDFVGRNLDWYINGNASAVIKIDHNDKHFASIGMVGCFPEFSNAVAEPGQYNDVYKYLPLKTEDGINEYGLYVGINVMPTGETSFDVDTWEPHKYGHGAAHTKPGATTYAVNYLPRVLLDRAKNVDEAMKLIDSIDWTEPMNYPHQDETQAFHFFICDNTRSVVLEFMDNKAVYTEAESITEPGFGTIMTNFTNALWAKDIWQINGIGYERFEILRDNYKNYGYYPDDARGMQALMSQVWFTKTYTNPIDSEDIWLTEFSSDDLPSSYLYRNYALVKVPELRQRIEDERQLFRDKTDWFTDRTSLWFTTHTSVYDMTDGTLYVMVHEGLNGQSSFMEIPFNSLFPLPLK